MKATYDPKVDAMYISFSEKARSSRTVELNADILLDFSGKKLIGIEILDASRVLGKKLAKTSKLQTTPLSI